MSRLKVHSHPHCVGMGLAVLVTQYNSNEAFTHALSCTVPVKTILVFLPARYY